MPSVYLVVLHRLMVPGSNRHASEWKRGYSVPGAEELSLDPVNKAMTWLGEVDDSDCSTAGKIEEALSRHRQPLFGEVWVAFFDTTTLRFEGGGGQSLGQRGHSKDFRGYLKQVVLGIVFDNQDRLFATFLMPGNTAYVSILLPVVARLRERLGIARLCIVAHRGMILADTIAALEAQNVDYILGARERSSREVREHFMSDDGVCVPLTIARQKGETQLAVKDVIVAGRCYVMCRNAEEAQKDAAARAEIIAGLERKLKTGDKSLVSNKGFRRFPKSAKGKVFVIDRAKIGEDAASMMASSCYAPASRSTRFRLCCARN